MVFQYATASELASYIQQDVDTDTAELLLQLASAEFNNLADTVFGGAIAATYQTTGTSARAIILPFKPVVSVTAVRIAGAVVTDYTRIRHKLYRASGFGSTWSFPPDLVEVDLTYGFTTVPDDVKGAVLEAAAQAYQQPSSAVVAETIDDYRVAYSTHSGGVQLTPFGKEVAAGYAGMYAA